jgi:hypothetical protein
MINRPVKFLLVGSALGFCSGGLFGAVMFLFYYQASKIAWFFGLGATIGVGVGFCAGLTFAILARMPQWWGAVGCVWSGAAGIWFVSRLTVPIWNWEYAVSMLPAALVFVGLPCIMGYFIAVTCSNDYQLDNPRLRIIRWLKN